MAESSSEAKEPTCESCTGDVPLYITNRHIRVLQVVGIRKVWNKEVGVPTHVHYVPPDKAIIRFPTTLQWDSLATESEGMKSELCM